MSDGKLRDGRRMRLTILCDNSVGPISGTLGEHGFAALIETADASFLFDTGSGGTLLHNAQRLKRDLSRVEQVFLSHGHYDHTGGLWPLLSSCGPKEVHAHPDLFARRYRVKDTGESLSIGIPYGEDFLRGCGARFHFSDAFREVAPGIFLTGSVPRVTTFESGDAGLYCDDIGCTPDLVPDDQSLVIRTSHGLVVLLGCCHAGLINTLRHAVAETGINTVYAVIGGTHLGFCAGEQLEATVKALREFRVEKLFPGHCSGFAAAARLLREFPGKVHPAQVGFTLEIQAEV